MSWYQGALLIGAIIAALIAWGNWRAIGWLVALQVSIAVSVAYWNAGWPYGELVAGTTDAAVCLLIYFFGRYQWEMWIWRLSQLSVAVNCFYLAGNIGIFYNIPHDVYSSILEAINWVAILSIGGTAILSRLDIDVGSAHRPWQRLRGALLSVRAKAPFTQARR